MTCAALATCGQRSRGQAAHLEIESSLSSAAVQKKLEEAEQMLSSLRSEICIHARTGSKCYSASKDRHKKLNKGRA